MRRYPQERICWRYARWYGGKCREQSLHELLVGDLSGWFELRDSERRLFSAQFERIAASRISVAHHPGHLYQARKDANYHHVQSCTVAHRNLPLSSKTDSLGLSKAMKDFDLADYRRCCQVDGKGLEVFGNWSGNWPRHQASCCCLGCRQFEVLLHLHG